MCELSGQRETSLSDAPAAKAALKASVRRPISRGEIHREPMGEAMRKALVFITVVLAACSLAAAAGAADYPVNGGGLGVSQNGSPTTTVAPGSTVTLSGSGFAPGASIQITIASTPRLLATVTADGSGSFTATVTIPSGLEPGTHTLSATGASASGGTVVLTQQITLGSSTSGSNGSSGAMAFTGGNAAALAGVAVVVFGVGFLFVMVTRRRRAAVKS